MIRIYIFSPITNAALDVTLSIWLSTLGRCSSAPESSHPWADCPGIRGALLLQRYLELVDQYETPVRIVRAHMHKMLGDWLQVTPPTNWVLRMASATCIAGCQGAMSDSEKSASAVQRVYVRRVVRDHGSRVRNFSTSQTL